MSGLVLGGGGGKGGYQIGVWKALRELGIEIEAVTGTSVGALNGAFVVQDRFDEAMQIWMNISPEQVMEVDGQLFNDLLNFNLKPTREVIESSLKWAERQIRNRGISIDPLRRMIDEMVDERRMRESGIPFGLVTFNLTDKQALEIFLDEIPSGKLPEYLLASSFLPSFESMELDGKFFLDGGFHDNLPINLMATRGIKDIIAVELKAIGIRRPVKDPEVRVTLIEPSGELGKLLEFDSEKSRRNIQMGYLDTLKIFGHLSGVRYFLVGVPNEKQFVTWLTGWREEEMGSLLTLMGMDSEPTTKTFLETAIPEISRSCGLGTPTTYTELVLGLLEKVAEQVGIERLEIYDFKQLVGMVLYRRNDLADGEKSFDLLKRIRGFIRTMERQSKAVQVAFRVLEVLDGMMEEDA